MRRGPSFARDAPVATQRVATGFEVDESRLRRLRRFTYGLRTMSPTWMMSAEPITRP